MHFESLYLFNDYKMVNGVASLATFRPDWDNQSFKFPFPEAKSVTAHPCFFAHFLDGHRFDHILCHIAGCPFVRLMSLKVSLVGDPSSAASFLFSLGNCLLMKKRPEISSPTNGTSPLITLVELLARFWEYPHLPSMVRGRWRWPCPSRSRNS